MTRVLMFGWEFPPFQAGGLATATLGLVKGLVSQGLDVTLVVPFPIGDGAAPLPALRVVSAAEVPVTLRTHRIASPLAPYASAEEYQVLSEREAVRTGAGAGAPGSPYGRNLFEEVERYAAAAAEIACIEPHDLIDTHDWITFAAGIRARAISGKPLVAHIHATEFDRVGEHGNPEIERREREGLHAADRIIANSHALRRQVIERLGIQPEKVDVVHWGVDAPPPAEHLHDLAVSRERPTVLFLGRITRQKGPDYFVEVAARVVRFVPDAQFIVAGTGDLLPRMIELSVELGLAGAMHFAGPVSGPDVDRAFRAADVCVMTSVSEPFGLVALESLRNGTPVIVPKTSGVAEVLSHALKSDFWDVDRMADQVVALLRHPELWQELHERSTAEIAKPRFGLDEPARRTASTYRAALTLAPSLTLAPAPALP